mgnify:CR=1 FL=1
MILMNTILTALRSLAFMLIFYSGSLLFVLAAMLAGGFDADMVPRIATGWSRFHRGCARWLLSRPTLRNHFVNLLGGSSLWIQGCTSYR